MNTLSMSGREETERERRLKETNPQTYNHPHKEKEKERQTYIQRGDRYMSKGSNLKPSSFVLSCLG